MSIISSLGLLKVYSHIAFACKKNYLCQALYRAIWADRIQRWLFMSTILGGLIMVTPHLIMIAFGFFMAFGSLAASLDHAKKRCSNSHVVD